MINTSRFQPGFTLLEMLAVISIVALLAAVAIPVYRDYTDRARSAEIIARYDALRTGAASSINTGQIENCSDLVNSIGQANLGEDYAELALGFEAVSGGAGGGISGWRPVLTVCASNDQQGGAAVRIAHAALEELSNQHRVESGAVVSDAIVSFSLPLTLGNEAVCRIAPSTSVGGCAVSSQQTPPQPAAVATPALASGAVAVPTPTQSTAAPAFAPPAVSTVELMSTISGATALSTYVGEQHGVAVGTRVVGLYMAGSSVNELGNVDPSQLPSVSNAYTRVADAGYQYLDQSGALGRLMPGRTGDLRPLAPSERNAWDGGIVVFSDGTVGRMQKAANGNGSEKDYIYFSVLPGVNANEGMAIVHGTAAPGQSVQVQRGSTTLGTVTADAQGNWNFAGVANIAGAGETITAAPLPGNP